ncbi:hypothetical protein IT570_07250 [Candidatus Sumerlaeota bacterium]|nr:hypothetical protein [Candidatus Sumerlaeota bacterium]
MVAAAKAQDTAAPEARKDLQTFQQNAYPSFVTRNEATNPVSRPTDETTTGTVTFTPEVLVDDVQSTTTWMSTRARLQPGLEELRLAMLSTASPTEISDSAQKLYDDISRIEIMAPAQAPVQQGRIGELITRIDKQVEFVVDDYTAGDFKRLQSSQDLLQRSLNDLEQVLRESDLDRGRPFRPPAALPVDWNAGAFASPGFADDIRNMRARELLVAYGDRIESIASGLKHNRQAPERDLEIAVEMGELARHLAERSNEVPVASQVPFRDAALRLDVISECLFEYIRDGRNTYTRRQLRHARETLNRCQAYLAGKQIAPSSISSSLFFEDAVPQ